jgi:DNA polymerase V
MEIAKFALQTLEQIFVTVLQYKKAGVIIMDFTPDSEIQLNFFENSNPKHSPLMQVVDRINQSFGQQKIKLAAQDLKRVWKMKQEKLSPRYTTRLDEVIEVRV